jgi:Asp-tRNA(Asn)/Glu-tRNA(Gln) amidotransferase A subunit family amidase
MQNDRDGSGETTLALLSRLRSGDLSAHEAVTAALQRCQQGSHLNAMISLRANDALAEADAADRQRRDGNALGALHGLPIVVKDNIAVGGWQFTGGSPAFEQHVASVDASVVAKLREAGAIVIGKSNLHELAFGTTSNNARFGAVRNPKDPSRIAGGSSGGSAVAVAAGFVTAAVASDTGGSGRIPAAFCGCVGLRPTIGRYAGDGVMNLSTTRDTISTMANTVADIALLDGIITGEAGGLNTPSRIRLGLLTPFAEADLDADVQVAFAAAIDRLKQAGVEIVSVDGSELVALDAEIGLGVVMAESARIWKELGPKLLGVTFAEFVERLGSPDVKGIFSSMLDPAHDIPDAAYDEMVTQKLPRLRAAYAELFAASGVDAFVFPTVPAVAPPLGQDDVIVIGGKEFPLFPTTIRNTGPGSLAGVPGITLPLPVGQGKLPVGLAFDGPSGSDRRLLAIAARIEPMLAAHT